jgi:NitT/TauT family transport system ATP-binding protein
MTVVFVTHNIQEAVLLSDAVVVMSARPGRVIERVSVGLERPRRIEMMSGAEFGRYTLEIRSLLGRAAPNSEKTLSAAV